MRAIFAALCCVLPTVTLAGTLGEQRQMDIRQINATDFEVFDGPRMGPHEFWCAAGFFNEYRLGRSELEVLYVRTPRGPSRSRAGIKSVIFTIDKTGLPQQPVQNTLAVDASGIALKSYIARRQCRDAFTRSPM